MDCLLEEQREIILSTMSGKQRDVLFQFKKRDIQSMFLNKIFSKEDEWELVDYNESLFYQMKEIAKEERLYCECGKELKYQYVLRSKKTNQEIGLSSKHFSDHTNIPLQIAKNVKLGIQEIDRCLDEILINFSKGHGFQYDLSSLKLEHLVELGITNRLKETIEAFCLVDLPLSGNDYWNIKKAIEDFEREIAIKEREKREQEWKERELSRKRPTTLRNQQLTEDIILIVDRYYTRIDMEIDIRELVNLLVTDSNYKNERLLGYVGPAMEVIANEICPGQLVRDSFYIYRKLTNQKIS